MPLPGPLALANAVLPGTGLTLRDRLWLGIPLVFLAILTLVLLGLAGLLASPEFARQMRWSALAGYGGLSVAASLAWWVRHREHPIDREGVFALHRSAAAAYLKGDLPTALTAARHLARAARDLDGAWHFLEVIATAAGSRRDLRRAARQRQRLALLRGA